MSDERRLGSALSAARAARLLRVAALSLALGACSGEVVAPGSSGSGDGQDSSSLKERPAPAPRFVRLTHRQWENTVRDLLHVVPRKTAVEGFRPDPTQQGAMFDNDATTFEVDEVLWGAYQRAAVEIAGQAVSDGAALTKLAPADASARSFVEQFGQRAFRRPLTSDEVDAYTRLYESAGDLYVGMQTAQAGKRIVIEAMLQSPHFLYRIEQSARASGDKIPLNGYEIAARLSYMLWDTMPDEQLLAAAQQGDLTRAEVAAEHATRMLEDPRAEAIVQHFHAQLMDVDHYSVIQPSPAFFPDAPSRLAESAVKESELFFRDLVFEQNGGLREALTSTETFVNKDLAQIYGLSGSFGDEFVRVTLDPAQRRGFLTQVGFLAAHATSVNPDPIHRGVFVARRVTCAPISAPPGNIPPLPPSEGRTNRETVEEHTEQPGSVCANCHATVINPLGFPFESYDAIGQHRTEDNGRPVDSSSTPSVDGDERPVSGAVELAEVLASSRDAHECYAKYWLEFAYGRSSVPADRPLIQRLSAASAEGTMSIKQMIVGLVKTDAFMTRSVEELP